MQSHGTVFKARWRGQCEECEGQIIPGDLVRYDGDYLVHDRCPEDDKPVLGSACPRCHLIHPGEC